MNLSDKWDNLPSETKYFTYTDVSEDGSEEKEGINMMSMLFCKHGGLITPVSSGQTKAGKTGKFVGYLAYGCKSITQNPEEGYYMLYDGPTVDGEGEVHMFADIYRTCGVRPYGALQGYGTEGLNHQAGTVYEGENDYNGTNGVLFHNGIYRHAVAIGPTLQNPNFSYNDKGLVDVSDMIYGTCIDITIEFEGETYYIPAVIVDIKAHTSPDGCIQSDTLLVDKDGDNKTDDNGRQSAGGNIVEWYVEQKVNGKNKSEGLMQFDTNGGIIIYRDEMAVVIEDEEK